MTRKPSGPRFNGNAAKPTGSSLPRNRFQYAHGPRTFAQTKEQNPQEKGEGPDQATTLSGFDLLGHNGPAPELSMLPISAIEIGDQILPVDASAVLALKEVFSIDRQIVPVPIRKHQDGRYELISGYADICALRQLGRSDVLALVVSGLSDLDARFLQIANNIHPKLPVLDRALLHARLMLVEAERAASQDETALSAHRDLSVRKIAEHLGFKKDVVLRLRKISLINPDVHQDIREAKFDDNQNALLEIAEAGATVAQQSTKLQELLERRSRSKQNRARGKGVDAFGPVNGNCNLSSNEFSGGMPDIPEFLRKNGAKVTYDQVKKDWLRCYNLFLTLNQEDRQQFINECAVPVVPVSISTHSSLPPGDGSE
jgi:ParB-like chromosome segregation protein Spo0J